MTKGVTSGSDYHYVLRHTDAMRVNYRIGGAVWGNKIQYELLTDTMNLLRLAKGACPVAASSTNAGVLLMCERATC